MWDILQIVHGKSQSMIMECRETKPRYKKYVYNIDDSL